MLNFQHYNQLFSSDTRIHRDFADSIFDVGFMALNNNFHAPLMCLDELSRTKEKQIELYIRDKSCQM